MSSGSVVSNGTEQTDIQEVDEEGESADTSEKLSLYDIDQGISQKNLLKTKAI